MIKPCAAEPSCPLLYCVQILCVFCYCFPASRLRFVCACCVQEAKAAHIAYEQGTDHERQSLVAPFEDQGSGPEFDEYGNGTLRHRS